jgi:hypothetical protein
LTATPRPHDRQHRLLARALAGRPRHLLPGTSAAQPAASHGAKIVTRRCAPCAACGPMDTNSRIRGENSGRVEFPHRVSRLWLLLGYKKRHRAAASTAPRRRTTCSGPRGSLPRRNWCR